VSITNIRASIHTTSIAIPLLEGKVAGYGREEQKEFVVCEVETDQGASGFGLTGHFLARSVVEALERHFLPVVKGMDPRDSEAMQQRVWQKLNPRAMTGVVSSALSCLDIACWDIDCRITWFEEPLTQNDARALADLRAHTKIPLAAGQMEGHRWRLRELVEKQAVDILQPNCCFCGGFTEATRVSRPMSSAAATGPARMR
jgi:L-alanine-DL-glutamate epimerase-like enolase superfamily enzyme